MDRQQQLDLGTIIDAERAGRGAGVLAVERIAERLDDSLRLLTTGGRTALPRQRTLRDTQGRYIGPFPYGKEDPIDMGARAATWQVLTPPFRHPIE